MVFAEIRLVVIADVTSLDSQTFLMPVTAISLGTYNTNDWTA